MPTPYSHDMSTQAMTEVALGLSMAFFALLIVALLSFQMPMTPDNNVTTPDLPAAEKIQLQQAGNNSSPSTDEAQFIFYYHRTWFDPELKILQLSNLDLTRPLVVAVDKNLSFSEVMKIKQQINHPNLSITLLTAEWQRLLEQQK